MKHYGADTRRMALEKLLRPGGASVATVSHELDIPKGTLYAWLSSAKGNTMSNNPSRKSRSDMVKKMNAVLTAKSLSDDELGRWLREEGYHEAQLKTWEQEIMAAVSNVAGSDARETAQRQRIKELEKELQRKDKALAEMSTLMVIKKKWPKLFGEDPET